MQYVLRSLAWRACVVVSVSVAGAVAPATIAQVERRTPAWLPDDYRYDKPFFDSTNDNPAIAKPDDLLGYPLGSRPALHGEIERCLLAWKASPRLKLFEYAQTHERRKLYYAVITSEKNHARLDDIRARVGKLADPRKLKDDAEAAALIKDTPGVAWMAYSIHGDELSSSDAALAMLYHLLASRDKEVEQLLDELVIVVDPLMNPDGRDRFIRQIDGFNGYIPNLDVGALQHQGRWPHGRGNHYLFDMNRDWIFGTQPETRGRQKAIADWQPQLLVDSHEMGPQETYLFNPPREPINPNISPAVRSGWQLFAGDQAAAFDRFGWSYYTREWLDYWYPGYTDAYSSFHGAVGMLYEQARTGGSPILQESGRVLTYREAVHHHLVSSLANLHTLRKNRTAIYDGFLKIKREFLAGKNNEGGDVFILARGANATRERAFLENLRNQDIEISVAQAAFKAPLTVNPFGAKTEQQEFPAGSILIYRKQAAAGIMGACLDFDPRMTPEFLAEERKELETKRQSRIYDVTAWSLPLAYDLDGYWCTGAIDVATKPYEPPAPAAGSVQTAERAYGYALDCSDDATPRALVHLLFQGVRVRVATEKDFIVAGRKLPRGSLLIRRHENDDKLEQQLASTAEACSVQFVAATTGRSPDDTPDLGGGYFQLLRKPRVALLGGHPVSTYSYGNIWHLLDSELGVPVSLYDVGDTGGLDLRRFDVLILPNVGGSAEKAYGGLLDDVKSWVKSGGTLIAFESAAAWLADEKLGLSGVRRRQDILKDLDEFKYAIGLERGAGKTKPDPAAVWGAGPETQPASMPSEDGENEKRAKLLEDWRQIFAPVGVIVRGELNAEHWLTSGCDPETPLFVEGATALFAKYPVKTPVRLAPVDKLRISGLLWPEAAARLADASYATVESVGSGQVILFACDPNFRGAWAGTRRLLINAVLLGPGCGTSAPVLR